MTTYEEISTNLAANRAFWTATAASYLHCYRDHRATIPHTAAIERQYFREAMAHRRNKTYYQS